MKAKLFVGMFKQVINAAKGHISATKRHFDRW
jgi:hypothetical protein